MTTHLDRGMTEREWYRHWLSGDLRYMLRPNGQTWLYNHIEACRRGSPNSIAPIVAECHRRMGKTFVAILRAVERCLRVPRSIVKIGAPTDVMVKAIVEPNLEDLLADAPPEFRPQRSGQSYLFHHPVGRFRSVLHIVGLDHKKGNRIRGQAADEVYIDEAGFVEHLENIAQSIVPPQFDRRKDPVFCMLSTPPPTMDHEFIRRYVPEAIGTARHILVDGEANPDLSAEDQERLLSAMPGGRGSIEWRREVKCHHVADEGRMVIPEILAAGPTIFAPHERPSHFIPWVLMDTGWSDYTAILFCYVDFERQLKVVEDMVWTHYKTTGEIAGMLREKCDALYSPEQREKLIMVADMTPQQLDDFKRDQKIFFEAADKHDPAAGIAAFRRSIQRGEWRICPDRAAPLKYQLENAVWNEKRTDFERTKQMGHCDALMAAVYGQRMITTTQNPFPDEPYDSTRQFRWEKPAPRADGLLKAYGKE